jgi:hypothetical protein
MIFQNVGIGWRHHTNVVILTGCFCIGPCIDSSLAVLAPEPIQKQPVRNTVIK